MPRSSTGSFWAWCTRFPPDFSPPRTIRLTPIPIYTSYADVWMVAQHLKAIIDNKGYEYSKDQKGMY